MKWVDEWWNRQGPFGLLKHGFEDGGYHLEHQYHSWAEWGPVRDDKEMLDSSQICRSLGDPRLFGADGELRCAYDDLAEQVEAKFPIAHVLPDTPQPAGSRARLAIYRMAVHCREGVPSSRSGDARALRRHGPEMRAMATRALRGMMRPSCSKLSWQTAIQCTANGDADPQSIDLNFVQCAGTVNGGMTCRAARTR